MKGRRSDIIQSKEGRQEEREKEGERERERERKREIQQQYCADAKSILRLYLQFIVIYCILLLYCPAVTVLEGEDS